MDLKKLGVRALITFTLGPFILFCVWKGGYLFLALVLSLVAVGILEFYDLAAEKVTLPQRGLGLAGGIGLCLLFYFTQWQHVGLLFAAVVLASLLFELFRNQVGPILNVSVTLAGLLYVAFLLGFLILIRELPREVGLAYGVGAQLVTLLLLSIWLCDTAAYLFGSRFGRHKLFERVSPNKTVEGTLFGFAFAVLTAYACQRTFAGDVPLMAALVVGAVCGSVGQVSDLVESLFKRDARVKDSSDLIPGHGGVLDRFDSEMLVAPVVYFYLKLAMG